MSNELFKECFAGYNSSCSMYKKLSEKEGTVSWFE